MNAFKTPEGKQAVLTYYDTLLQKLTVPYEELQLETRYGHTNILAVGNPLNPPLVLLHGSSINATMWIGDINIYSRYFRVYAPDMPGEPGKSTEEQLPLNTSNYVDWLYDVMSGIGIPKAKLMGASLGAWLAAKFAISNPQMIEKLVLLCPAGIGSQNHAFKDIAISLLSKGEEGIDELFRQINGGAEIPEIILNYQKLIATPFNSRMEVIPRFTDNELQALTMPSLLIVGGKDIMLNSRESATRYQQLVPSGMIKIIPHAGHSLTGLTSDITAFL